MHSKSSEVTIKVKIQNLGSRKVEKVKIRLSLNKQLNIQEKIIEKLSSADKWNSMTDQIYTLYIRNEKTNEKYRTAPTKLTLQKGDKFLIVRKRDGETIKRKKVRRTGGTSSSYSPPNDDSYTAMSIINSMTMDNCHSSSFSHHSHCDAGSSFSHSHM